jgi:cytochrome c oxidase accessory protein FixG
MKHLHQTNQDVGPRATRGPAPGGGAVAQATGVGEERILSTLNADGSRRWLCPKLSAGRFLSARRWVAYGLIVLYAALPFVPINGHPALLLDVAHRKFHVLGATFLATDTVLMAVLAISIGLAIFLMTALLGRVWCGWACPQTVYMEFVYRPVERFFSDKQGRCDGWRRWAKYGVYALISGHLSNVFLAYFVGAENVYHWTLGSPLDHPWAFLLVVAVAAMMMFDFCFFREQTCIVACPYGRLQSALLDRHSLIVTYDAKRGEPRRPMRTNAGDVSLKQMSLGDCINCVKCVTTCPTGIDIREGLQMECIGCAQCIDACDAVMEKIGKPRGLIRYSSQAMVEGQTRTLWRARTVIYPVLLTVAVGAFVVLLANRKDFDVDLLPRQGTPFYELEGGEIANQIRFSLANRTDYPAVYRVTLAGGGDGGEERGEQGGAVPRIVGENPAIELGAQGATIVSLVAAVPKAAMGSHGSLDVRLVVSLANEAGTDGKASQTLEFHMLGPANRSEHHEREKEGHHD